MLQSVFASNRSVKSHSFFFIFWNALKSCQTLGSVFNLTKDLDIQKKQPDMQPCPAGRACTSKQMIASKIAISEKQKTQSFIMKRASLVLN
jgi:hypothetical protein